jgi:hypothetical protein
MASPDDLIPFTNVLMELRDAGLPGIDRNALAERRYGNVHRLYADGRIRAERTGRTLNVRRMQLPDVAVELGVLSLPSSVDAAT